LAKKAAAKKSEQSAAARHTNQHAARASKSGMSSLADTPLFFCREWANGAGAGANLVGANSPPLRVTAPSGSAYRRLNRYAVLRCTCQRAVCLFAIW